MNVDVDHLHALIANHDPGCELVRITRPEEGLANDALYVSTTRRAYVLKVFDDTAEKWKPQKERALFDSMRSIGLPAPHVYRIDASRRVAPFIYSLNERCPGEPLSQAFTTLSETVTLRIYASLGDYLGRLHSTTFDRFGDVAGSADGLQVVPLHEWEGHNDSSDVGPFTSWRDMHAATVNGRLRFLQGTSFGDVVPAVARYFDTHQNLIDDAVMPRLLHMDLHPGNVHVHHGRVSATSMSRKRWSATTNTT